MRTYVLLLVLIVSVLSCSRDSKSKRGSAEQQVVGSVTLKDVISQTGVVEPVVKVDIKSEASGRIEKIYVQEGQRVSQGDTILKIDPRRLLTRKKKLDLSLQRARIELAIAKRDYENNLQLAGTGTVSKKVIEDSKSTYELKEIALAMEKLELEDILYQLEQTVVNAPMSGVLTSLAVEEGEIAVSATSGFQSGTDIGTVADVSQLEVVTQIGEVDYIHLQTGQAVEVIPAALENTKTTGTITFISLTAKMDSRTELSTFDVRIAIDSLIPGIVPGINVNVDFVLLEETVPVAVLYHFVEKTERGAFVLIKADGGEKAAKRKKITLGKTDYKYYEVLEGLRKGDTVLFDPQKTERNGNGRKRNNS